MSKVYIIPGFRHEITDNEYEWLFDYLRTLGYQPIGVKITWNNRVMSDYISEFMSQYRHEKSIIIGFSFGAMIAAITAQDTKPSRLFLLSLSPYFSGDLPDLKEAWKRNIGARRLADFEKFKLEVVSGNLPEDTLIFYGAEEGRLYPSLKKTCIDASRMSNTKLIEVHNAPHSIRFSEYQKAIKAELG